MQAELIEDVVEFEDLYMQLGSNDPDAVLAELLLRLRHWYIRLCEFDPRTNQAVPRPLSMTLRQINASQKVPVLQDVQDRLTCIFDKCFDAIQTIIVHPREKIQREYDIIPVYRAREVDSTTVQWLSRQSGRNLREKLAGKPNIKALTRRLCFDTAENRLVKACLQRMEHILLVREETIGLDGDTRDRLQLIQGWLHSPETDEIKTWAHLPPNNVLLQERNYRKLWDAWQRLQFLDELTTQDMRNRGNQFLVSLGWELLAKFSQISGFYLPEQPCLYDYDNFRVTAPSKSIKALFLPESKTVAKVERVEDSRKFLIARNDSKRSVFCHMNAFREKGVFGRIMVGDLIQYNEITREKGLSAKDIELFTRDRDNSATEFCLSWGDDNHLTCAFGNTSVTAEVDAIANHACLYRQNSQLMRRSSLAYGAIADLSYLMFRELTAGALARKGNAKISEEISERATVLLQTIGSIAKHKEHAAEVIPSLLLTQYWPVNNFQNAWNYSELSDHIATNCAYSSAIFLKDGIASVSLKTLLSNREGRSDIIHTAAENVAHQLASDVVTQSLTYVLPDYLTDFDTETLRHQINLAFVNAQPLPKSIAAILAWQHSEHFTSSGFKQSSIVFVLDQSDGFLHLTPVVSKYHSGLHKRVARTSGIVWERHPTLSLPLLKSEPDSIASAISDTWASGLSSLFTIEELSSCNSRIAFVDGQDKWLTLSDHHADQLKKEQSGYISFTYSDIEEAITQITASHAPTWFLPTSDLIKKPGWIGSGQWIDQIGNNDIVCAGDIQEEWLSASGLKAIWKDHLPKLSTRTSVDGREQNFYFVNKTAIQPERGKKVRIPITDTFTLPAGKDFYEIPLQMQGRTGARYVARLDSDKFRLSKDAECDLELTYTYGDDQPYCLKFISRNPEETGFVAITAKWEQREEVIQELYPDYPQEKRWDDFYDFDSGVKEKDNTNLFNWADDQFSFIIELYEYLDTGSNRSRITVDTEGCDWFTDRNGKRCCKFYNGELGEIFIHEGAFEEPLDGHNIISFDVQKRERGLYAQRITRGLDVSKNMASNYVEKWRKGLRFPVLVMWNNGNSLSDADIPDGFRSIAREAISAAHGIHGKTEDRGIKGEMLQFLSYLHKDMPEVLSKDLLDLAKNSSKLQFDINLLAYSLSDLNLVWQKTILDALIGRLDEPVKIRSAVLNILSIAAWRHRDFVLSIPVQSLEVIMNSLISSFDGDLKTLTNTQPDFRWVGLVRNLELALALLRIRSSEDATLQSMFRHSSPFITKLCDIVLKINDKHGESLFKRLNGNASKVTSRVALQTNKPKQFSHTPDILYALKLYLTGDSGANLITISKVTDQA